MQVKPRLPSLRAVEIFVAAGRALSFAAAAQSVNLTPSAVSRRIRSLERELGTPLAAASAADQRDANKRLVRDFIQTAINDRQPDAAGNYFAADYIEHNPRLPVGVAGKKQFIASLLTGFSDYHGEIQEMVADGDKVVTRTRWTGTQDGPFVGRPATGNKLDFTTADFYRIDNGKIVEHWDVVDTLARAVGLGLVPPPK